MPSLAKGRCPKGGGGVVFVIDCRKVKKMYLPSDPNILLSVINTKLRDEYSSLDDLCDSLDVDKEDLTEKLKSGGFKYNASLNQFE